MEKGKWKWSDFPVNLFLVRDPLSNKREVLLPLQIKVASERIMNCDALTHKHQIFTTCCPAYLFQVERAQEKKKCQHALTVIHLPLF